MRKSNRRCLNFRGKLYGRPWILFQVFPFRSDGSKLLFFQWNHLFSNWESNWSLKTRIFLQEFWFAFKLSWYSKKKKKIVWSSWFFTVFWELVVVFLASWPIIFQYKNRHENLNCNTKIPNSKNCIFLLWSYSQVNQMCPVYVSHPPLATMMMKTSKISWTELCASPCTNISKSLMLTSMPTSL